MRAAVEPLGVALLAGKPDAVNAGQPPRLTNVANETVDGVLELSRGHKGLDGQRHDRLAGIGCLASLFDKVDHLASHRGAVQRAGKERDDEAQPIAFIITDREQMAFVGALGIGQRLALAVDHPADRASAHRAAP